MRVVGVGVSIAVLLCSVGCTVVAGGAEPPPEVTGEPGKTISIGAPGQKKPGERVILDGQEFSAPPGLEFPDGSKVSKASFDVDEQTVTLSAPKSSEVLKHFDKRLPRTGFAVAESAGTPNERTFDGKGWSGSITATSADETVVKFWQYRPDPISASALKLVNVPFFLKFPGGTKAASLSDPKTGANLRFASPSPPEVLRYYRDAADGPFWDIVKDTTTGGTTTTLVFTDDDGWTVTITTTATTATLATRAP
ncbi:hypothetical protein [Streptomyces sp. SID13031]|uniref:hypothetical protein n=1 Tax=Streptomyces sp. SID13031 TaxID=2706046 RepID=UPI0013CA54D2|nr:hypothetical protein [Streptomyces sp. SID13031]NEA31449.1 hypothetical protein [Streptomyces sp. SID13031]